MGSCRRIRHPSSPSAKMDFISRSRRRVRNKSYVVRSRIVLVRTARTVHRDWQSVDSIEHQNVFPSTATLTTHRHHATKFSGATPQRTFHMWPPAVCGKTSTIFLAPAVLRFVSPCEKFSNFFRRGPVLVITIMFSWSQTATKRQSSSSSSSSQYPGRRINNNTRNGVTAPVVEGSIRPPPSPQDLTRAQHLESYLEDATLQRSTRRVSAGTFSTGNS